MLLEEYEGQTKAFTLDGEPRQVTYLTRVDPFSGNVSKISVGRVQRSIGISSKLEMRPVENCAFCDYKKRTPKERIEHTCGAVSVPNLYPWEKYDWITIYPPFTKHKLFLSELTLGDMERMLESSYELAAICAKDAEVISFMDFTNWGVFAGASQQHAHSQRKSVTQVPSPSLDNEMKHCHQLMECYGQNPFAILEEEERSNDTRIIQDNGIFIASMFAPMCSDEILVFPSEDIAHIIQTTENERRKIAQSIVPLFPALFFCRGITNLNIAIHMASFAEMERARKYYRWHIHIYPRQSKLPVDQAGAEMGFSTQVIDVLPEVSAEILRCWYRDGPKEELIGKTIDGFVNSRLIRKFKSQLSLPQRGFDDSSEHFY